MSNTVKLKVMINQDLRNLSKVYCDYVSYLIDFLSPEDQENLHLFSMAFSKVKPKIRYILKPLRQNFQLTRPFFSLAERRALTLLRNFCRALRKNLVNYIEEVRLGYAPTLPIYLDKLDLNGKVAKIFKGNLFISFGKQTIKIDLNLNELQDLNPIQIDLAKDELLLLAPSKCDAYGAQSGTRFVTNLCHS